ncbi:flagellar FliL protein [Allopseudospirillum japonicum]|uniref:Flagellar protein FliL n=1 Tax=Allopseudospirillum japonicum TaxID=64971 RepID=A0A1H6QXE6_9GAMM|nr:flagellar basal body-associated FliL family protein [Allopseudospirillum japonicum]SEI45624.1 flagellar FliL protein [Allopseudospirillum japonicum]
MPSLLTHPLNTLAFNRNLLQKFLSPFALILMLFGAPCVQAAASGGEGAITYVQLEPSFVVNYGGEGRLKYLKTDITLVTNGGLAEDVVKQHLPLLRNQLMMLLSRQTDESVTTNEGKERLRKEALEEVRQTLEKEVQHPVVEDLLFTTFIYQG